MEMSLGNLVKLLRRGTVLEVYSDREEYEHGTNCLFTVGGMADLHTYLLPTVIDKPIQEIQAVGPERIRCFIVDRPVRFEGTNDF